MNIQQPNKSEVSNTETVMAYNEDIDLTPPQDILNVFAAVDLSSCSSYDSNKYKRAWLKAKVIRFYIFLMGNVQTHTVEHYTLHLIIKKLHLFWR